eukprot:354283-Chlamydomonas_euryale.AAC.3
MGRGRCWCGKVQGLAPGAALHKAPGRDNNPELGTRAAPGGRAANRLAERAPPVHRMHHRVMRCRASTSLPGRCSIKGGKGERPRGERSGNRAGGVTGGGARGGVRGVPCLTAIWPRCHAAGSGRRTRSARPVAAHNAPWRHRLTARWSRCRTAAGGRRTRSARPIAACGGTWTLT